MFGLRIQRGDEDLAGELQRASVHRLPAALRLRRPRPDLHRLGLGKIQMPELRGPREERPREEGRRDRMDQEAEVGQKKFLTTFVVRLK